MEFFLKGTNTNTHKYKFSGIAVIYICEQTEKVPQKTTINTMYNYTKGSKSITNWRDSTKTRLGTIKPEMKLRKDF